MSLLTTAQMIERYGQPNQSGTYLRSAKLPFPMKLAWAPDTVVRSIRCHQLEVERVQTIFELIFKAYGQKEISDLGIDLFGGCFNFRQMRGGSDWSKHSWGTAIDLDPERNQLKWGADRARFAKAEYGVMISIFQANGWVSLGREQNRDWMHFEALS